VWEGGGAKGVKVLMGYIRKATRCAHGVVWVILRGWRGAQGKDRRRLLVRPGLAAELVVMCQAGLTQGWRHSCAWPAAAQAGAAYTRAAAPAADEDPAEVQLSEMSRLLHNLAGSSSHNNINSSSSSPRDVGVSSSRSPRWGRRRAHSPELGGSAVHGHRKSSR
jgi:hypothetical protein